MDEDFPSSLDHLLTEFKRIELKLHLQVMRLRQEGRRTGEDRFRGLYISEDEIDTMVSAPPSWRGDSLSALENPTIATLSESLEQLEANITEKKRRSLSNGRLLRLHELERLFHLSTFDIETLLICILPELDLKYQKLYGYLQDDVTKKNPTVNLLLHLLGDSFKHRLIAREAFLPEAPLIRHHLLRLYDPHDSGKVPLLGKSLRADERITNYLLGTDQIDACLLPFTRLVQPAVKLEDVILPDDTRCRLTRLATQFQKEGVIYYFRGGYGVGKHTTAEAICHQLGMPMVSIDVNRMVTADIPTELSVQFIFREGLLQKAALYFSDCDLLFSNEREIKPSYDTMIQELESYPHWVFLAGEKYWEPRDVLHQRPFVNLEFPTPSYPARRQLWERQWNGRSPIPLDGDFSDLAGKFQFSGGQIRDTVATARNLALWRAPENGLVTSEDLYTACREQFGQRLNTLARKVRPKYDWDDIVLPRDQTEQLLELCSYINHRHTVSDDWGFRRKHSRGEGLNALFGGPSGTGKTMAAEIIANKLGLDLYKIDLATIVSKYIGETEKNLDRVFRAGQSSNAILFFDEADALFGKRSEVRDSHDRYANIEIAYLLQKMEEYDGMVILATNLRKNIDEAFARRMQFTVEFPHPNESDRYRIWQGVFPREAPVAKDTDFSFLARQFKITGGNIKNIALAAAFLAAEDDGCITTEKLIRATKREYQKIGKLCTEDDFIQYFELVKG